VKRASYMLCALACLVSLASSCATTGASGKGDENLPSAGVGPFRKLAEDEVAGVAPFVLDDKTGLYREPSAIADGARTLLFAVGRDAGKDVIVRTRADDGRSFYGTGADTGRRPLVVLSADRPWEGDALHGPFALRVGGEMLLFYAGADGIGLSRSADGLTFTKEPTPVLVREPSWSWETTAPRGPSAYVDSAGRTHLFFASGASIGEAISEDGVAFRHAGAVLHPAAPPDALLPNEKPPFDTASVGDPNVTVRVTPAGRLHVRVLYTGRDASGASSIGLAARYGDDGPLERASLPVYAVGQKEAAPTLLEGSGGTFLYVQQERRGAGSDPGYSAIAAAFAPGNVKLPLPAPFPDGP
jgi:hypothetical protein